MSQTIRVRVGNAGGYWGDDLGALHRQLTQGPLDYVTLDFLAELTMSILRKQRSRSEELGYATDFLNQMRTCLPLLEKTGTKIISNAGGINPGGCAQEVSKITHQLGIQTVIAVVEGDDLMDCLGSLLAQGIDLRNLETGEDFESIQDRVESANAYLGVAPVVEALEKGAQLIITGRVTDTAMVAAAPAFEFEWGLEDWDRLASAVIAGHILECGAQATGGNLTDWGEVPSFSNIGYPIAEFYRDGSFCISKHEKSGGLVNRKTVTSQLVYEMGDPRNYITPDVTADFSTIRLEEQENQTVKVWGAKGRSPTDKLKVSISYRNGYKAHGMMIVSQPEAEGKCRALADILWKKLDMDFEETSTELVGHSACHRRLAPSSEPGEILLRLGVRDPNREKVERFATEFTSLILNTVPGIAIVGAKPRIQQVIAYWPCLIPASQVTAQVTLLDSGRIFHIPWKPTNQRWQPADERNGKLESTQNQSRTTEQERLVPVPLIRLCYARSGDKGDTCNIGVVARSPEIYQWICRELTAERIKGYFTDICQGEVERFEIPNLLALNFLLHNSLGGGGTVSLRIDPQGKTLADALLMLEMKVPETLLT